MLPYKNLILIDRESTIPLYKQISLQLIELILDGKLLPGTKLPSTRSFAEDLQLHRKTVVAVYEILVAENWVESLPRSGYRVSTILPVVRPRTYQKKASPFQTKGNFEFDKLDVIQFPLTPESNKNIIVNDGAPDTTLLPYTTLIKNFRKALDRITVKNDLDYKVEPPSLKTSLRNHLSETRGIDFGIENIFITRGAQMALFLAASLILKPGDKVVITEPSYVVAGVLFEKLGATIIRVPVDQHGMKIDVLETILKTNDIKLIYTIPHHHHPTTVTMTMERRNHMLQLIRTYKPVVIEDDYDYDFQFNYDPYLPLASGDHGGNIIYIGSLTKVLGTPFRVGYMIATEEFLTAVAKMRVLVDIRGDLISEKAIAAMIDSGDLGRHIQRTVKIYAKRCETLCYLLDTELKDYLSFTKPSGGLAVWINFKEGYDLLKIAQYAHSIGLSLKSDIYFKGQYAHYNSLRFGYAALDESKIKTAVGLLKKAIQHLYPDKP